MTEHFTGRVKWFNNKAGYGFLTVVDNSARKGEDVFVHHSAIAVEDSQYKYLVQGEYVDFDLMASEKHQWQATAVTGVYGGKLMCETRREARSEASATVEASATPVAEEPVQSSVKPVRAPRQRKPPKEPSQQKKSSEPNVVNDIKKVRKPREPKVKQSKQ